MKRTTIAFTQQLIALPGPVQQAPPFIPESDAGHQRGRG